MRRPSQSAWLINLLWRDQRDGLEQLFRLSDELGGAHSASDLQRLTARRRELEDALIRRARRLAEEAGITVSASTERELHSTLGAALAQPEVADEVRTGRLVKPAAYAGFGTVPAGMPAPKPEPREVPAASRQKQDDGEAPAGKAAREAREEARRRRVEEARAAANAAAGDLAEQERLAGAARQQHQELVTQVEELDARLRQLREATAAAGRAAVAATRRREQAEKAHEAAVRILEGHEKP